MAGKRILIIDDHYEVQDFLRSMLELASDDFLVHSAPSAEEGWLELLRVPFDLLITDLRLPGMSGFELARMAQKRFPALPILLITGNDSTENRQEAVALNVQLFAKPLDTGRLMAAVEEALGADPAPTGRSAPVAASTPPPPPAGAAPDLPPVIVQRLDHLRGETGADQILLATLDGVVCHSSGSAPDLSLPAIVANACSVITRAMQLGAYLNPDLPGTLQYHRGAAHDLYTASVGDQYVLLALVRAQTRRARVGTMWVFFQRAVNDILAQLAELTRLEEAAAAAGSDVAITRPLPVTKKMEQKSPPEDPPAAAEETAGPEAEHLDDQAFAALQDLLSETEEAEPPRSALDDFWDSAVDESLAGEGSGQGLTLEEARRQGLLPADFGADGEENG